MGKKEKTLLTLKQTKILDWTELTALADEKLNVDQIDILVKGEIVGYHYMYIFCKAVTHRGRRMIN